MAYINGTKLQGWEIGDWKRRVQTAGLENAVSENARTDWLWKACIFDIPAFFSLEFSVGEIRGMTALSLIQKHTKGISKAMKIMNAFYSEMHMTCTIKLIPQKSNLLLINYN